MAEYETIDGIKGDTFILGCDDVDALINAYVGGYVLTKANHKAGLIPTHALKQLFIVKELTDVNQDM